MNIEIEKFISVIRDSFIGSQQVYTEGSCYHFYLILREVFPEAECWYDLDHVITKIDEKFYDITGEIFPNIQFNKLDRQPTYSLKAPFNIYKKKD
jgi:hypothetical protein